MAMWSIQGNAKGRCEQTVLLGNAVIQHVTCEQHEVWPGFMNCRRRTPGKWQRSLVDQSLTHFMS